MHWERYIYALGAIDTATAVTCAVVHWEVVLQYTGSDAEEFAAFVKVPDIAIAVALVVALALAYRHCHSPAIRVGRHLAVESQLCFV